MLSTSYYNFLMKNINNITYKRDVLELQIFLFIFLVFYESVQEIDMFIG